MNLPKLLRKLHTFHDLLDPAGSYLVIAFSMFGRKLIFSPAHWARSGHESQAHERLHVSIDGHNIQAS